MGGFQVQLVGGPAVLQARQLPDGSWVQELAFMPSRWTGVAPSEKISVGSGAVVGLSPPGGATHAVLWNDPLIASPQPIRYYDTGDTPSAVNGAPLLAGQALEVDLVAFSQLKMICPVSGQTAILHVLYRKYG